MEERRKRGRKNSRDEGWKREGRSRKYSRKERWNRGGRWGGSRPGIEQGKGVQQKRGMKKGMEYSRGEE
jgi:hypothetical protein